MEDGVVSSPSEISRLATGIFKPQSCIGWKADITMYRLTLPLDIDIICAVSAIGVFPNSAKTGRY